MEIEQHTLSILEGVQHIIENARTKVAVFLNTETTLLYWQIGDYINQELLNGDRARYGAKIVATLSQQLTIKNGKGYSYSALTRMCKVAMVFDTKIIATVSQQLSWSHLIELAAIENKAKRDFSPSLV